MKKKIFTGLAVSLMAVIGVSCGSLAEPAQKTDEQPVVTQKNEGEERLYFEKDFYLSDNGENLPINSIAAELLDTVMPQSFRQVADTAEVIVIGEPLESLEESEVKVQDDGMKGEFSISDFEIESVLKGNFQAGDMISLGQDVAISDDEIYRLPVTHENWNARFPGKALPSLVLTTPNNYRPVKKGSKYILFLYKRTDAGTDAYFPIYYALGRFNVDGTDELNYEPYGEMPNQLKIRDYALELYQAVMKEPDQNLLTRIVEQSDSAFVEN
jgi:hypothetical protein